MPVAHTVVGEIPIRWEIPMRSWYESGSPYGVLQIFDMAMPKLRYTGTSTSLLGHCQYTPRYSVSTHARLPLPQERRRESIFLLKFEKKLHRVSLERSGDEWTRRRRRRCRVATAAAPPSATATTDGGMLNAKTPATTASSSCS